MTTGLNFKQSPLTAPSSWSWPVQRGLDVDLSVYAHVYRAQFQMCQKKRCSELPVTAWAAQPQSSSQNYLCSLKTNRFVTYGPRRALSGLVSARRSLAIITVIISAFETGFRFLFFFFFEIEKPISSIFFFFLLSVVVAIPMRNRTIGQHLSEEKHLSSATTTSCFGNNNRDSARLPG